jgi:hypothetical protein
MFVFSKLKCNFYTWIGVRILKGLSYEIDFENVKKLTDLGLNKGR